MKEHIKPCSAVLTATVVSKFKVKGAGAAGAGTGTQHFCESSPALSRRLRLFRCFALFCSKYFMYLKGFT